MITLQARILRSKSYDRGWTVAKAELDGPASPDWPIRQGDTFSLVGSFTARAGDILAVSGEWVTHERFGLQLKVASAVPVLAGTEEGLCAFLGRLPQVGPVRARALIRALGREGVLLALESAPARLTVVDGISPDRAEACSVSYKEQKDLYESWMYLTPVLGEALTAAALGQWEGRAKSVVDRDPYMLMGLRGGTFKVVDDIARKKLGVREDDPRRCAAGARVAVEDVVSEGHCFASRERLMGEDVASKARALTGLDAEQLSAGLDVLAADYMEDATGRLVPLVVLDGGWVHHRQCKLAEESIASGLRRLMSTGRRVPVPGPLALEGLSDEQKAAVIGAHRSPVFILTGGPGVGKSHTISTLIDCLEGAGLSCIQCAPTGKAAQRMKELTGRPAATIHRLLAGVADGTVDAKVVIADEMSMIDVHLMARLVSAIPDGGRLVIVGDVDQLPSIGPGSVLGDLLASEALPSVRLTKIFRQAADSAIPYVARDINEGFVPDFSGPLAGVALVEEGDAVRLQDAVVQSMLALGPESTIVVAPQRNHDMGVEALNRRLQAELTPGDDDSGLWIGGQYRARVGDRVLHTHNDYNIATTTVAGVFNGEIGSLIAADFRGIGREELDRLGMVYCDAKDELGFGTKKTNGVVAVVDYGDRLAAYGKGDLKSLHLGWALTVHKMQGSQMPNVVLVCHSRHQFMLDRALCYTAVTRAAKTLLVLGEGQALAAAVRSTHRKERWTGLRGLLAGAGS